MSAKFLKRREERSPEASKVPSETQIGNGQLYVSFKGTVSDADALTIMLGCWDAHSDNAWTVGRATHTNSVIAIKLCANNPTPQSNN